MPDPYVDPILARRRVARFETMLSVADRGRVATLLDVMGQRRELTVAEARSALFGDRSEGAATKAMERLRDNVNEAAVEAKVDLQIEVRGAKRSGAHGASAESWRYLRAKLFDAENRLLGLQPYELYHPTSGSALL